MSAARRPIERRSGDRLRVPCLTVLWHPEVARVGERARLEEVARGREALVTRSGPAFASPAGGPAVPLAHASLDGLRLRLAPGDEQGGVVLMTGGEAAVRVDRAPLDGLRRLGAADVERGVVVEVGEAIVLLLHDLPASEPREADDCGLIGASERLVEMRREVRRVADLDVPVLLTGETGTGKELMARAIHRRSRRRERAYLAVNCGAIPPSLAAAELFGAARGAFTGAVQRQMGYFARADRGTLFLDEVGEAPADVQVMLLRVLERGEVQPLGVQETQRVDVRLLAATDADLERAAEEGRFRAPLFHRLAAYEIAVPPLRQRRDDLGRLLVAFLRRELAAVGEERRLDGERAREWLPASIVARLAGHDWPGNVRQLENAARQIVIGSRGAATVRIGPQLERLLREADRGAADGDGPPERASGPAGGGRPRAPRRRNRHPAEVEEEAVVAALRRHHWAIKPAAEELGVSRGSLYALIDRIPDLRKAADLVREEVLRAREACAGDLHGMSDRLEVSVAGLQQRMRELGIEA
ncbi:MAG TPA: sigma 54-interacting transcriptional regulator [Thermoanaerobaculia bacterium]